MISNYPQRTSIEEVKGFEKRLPGRSTEGVLNLIRRHGVYAETVHNSSVVNAKKLGILSPRTPSGSKIALKEVGLVSSVANAQISGSRCKRKPPWEINNTTRVIIIR